VAPQDLQLGALTHAIMRIEPQHHYLARTGYESQQTSEPIDPNRPDNLFEPVAGNWGAHGVFSDRASGRSEQLWADTHRFSLALAGASLAGLFLLFRRPAA
jgi:hypothetical protein